MDYERSFNFEESFLLFLGKFVYATSKHAEGFPQLFDTLFWIL